MCVCVYMCFLVHIPVATLRAANPPVVKGLLNSRVAFLNSPHTHMHISCKLNAWAHMLHTRHMNAYIRCKPKLRLIYLMCYSCRINVCYSWHHLCYSSSGLDYFSLSRLSEMSPDWKLDFRLPACQIICLYLSGLDSVSPSVCIYLSVSSRGSLLSPNKITNDQWKEHLRAGQVDVLGSDYQIISDRRPSPL